MEKQLEEQAVAQRQKVTDYREVFRHRRPAKSICESRDAAQWTGRSTHLQSTATDQKQLVVIKVIIR